MRVAVQREHALRSGVVEDGVGVFGGRNPAQRLEGLQIEHRHGLVVARCGKSMARAFRYRGSVRAFDAGDFAQQLPAVFIHHHHSVLPRDKQTVIGRIGHNVIPTSIPTQRVGVGHPVRRG